MAAKKLHAEWMSMVERSGPFLTTPVLDRVFPQGLDAHDPELARTLRLAFEEWEADREGSHSNPAIHNAWIKFVLTETLGLPSEALAEGQAIPESLKATMAQHGEVLRPDFVVRNPVGGPEPGVPRLLIQIYPAGQNLEKQITGRRWIASPATRMTELLHATETRLGLVTNGEQWMLVHAPKNETSGFASWYSSLWLEEKTTLQAFRSLLSARRFFSVPHDETLDAMLAESATRQQEVTDQLGLQVRRAVEVLIQSLDRADQDHGRQLLVAVPETVLYEAALTVMMRLVFLFCAEERGLLLLDDELYERNYAVSTLVERLQQGADQHGEEVLERRFDAWVRLLTTFRAVYGGVHHERMRLPAYGGNLFDPDRFPFLEGRASTFHGDIYEGAEALEVAPAGAKQIILAGQAGHAAGRQDGPAGSWLDVAASPLPVNNRTVLHLLRSLQYLEMQGEAQRLSFRALDIEQIGHVYEGLLDHTAKRATEPILGLTGAKGKECEIPLAKLEDLSGKNQGQTTGPHLADGEGLAAAVGNADLVGLLQEQTGRSESALRRALEMEPEPGDADKVRAACGNDDSVYNRVRRFVGLLRNDPFGRPVVIRKGSVYVTAGTDRRSSGTHYTPRTLTEPIVKHTLEPLVYVGPAEGRSEVEWELKSSSELLDLKICDMACGSGAFLVQVCRYLSELLVEAWGQAERAHPGAPGVTPEGKAAKGEPGEALIPKDKDERLIYAKRLIAQRCLYGVDKNPLAVEMAKLSLWLLTLAKDKPFTFLDHAIRCGDSLVGIRDLNQLKHFNLDLTAKQTNYFSGPVLRLVDEAVELRKKIESRLVNTIEDFQAEEQLFKEAQKKIARLRCAADLLIAVEFQSANAREKAGKLNDMAIQAGYYVEKSDLDEFAEVAWKAMNGLLTFHWPLEFPEAMSRGGFDAFVCNPPFLGGKRISTFHTSEYEKYLKSVLTDKKGGADLCAYFFLRAFDLLAQTGNLGLLATNTISQTDTREIGLKRIERDGAIINANSSMPWPGTANVVVALVHAHKGHWRGSRILDERSVESINSYLTVGESASEPKQLANKMQGFYGTKGTYVHGKGFILSYEEKERMMDRDPKNIDVLQPYLIAQDFTSHPNQEPSRWVINFGDMTQEEAALYAAPWDHVVTTVKPIREALRGQIHEKCFWKFWDRRDELYDRAKTLDRVIVCPEVSKYNLFALVRNVYVFSHMVNIIASNNLAVFAVMQSSMHGAWAWKHGSTMKSDLRYTTTTCLDTFPFPSINALVVSLGEIYHVYRAEIMTARLEGLTKTYNRFHNPEESSPDIRHLRALHVEMDNAVAAAYGWTDLKLDHDFHQTKQGIRFTISGVAQHEVLDRLLDLNHERYAEEVRQGLHEKKGGVRKSKDVRKPGHLTQTGQPAFFADPAVCGPSVKSKG